MNGLTLLAILALAVGFVVVWRVGIMQGRREAATRAKAPLRPTVSLTAPQSASATTATASRDEAAPSADAGSLPDAQAHLLRALEAANATQRDAALDAAAERTQLIAFAADRRRLLHQLAAARAETARYRDIVVDLENNALPPLLDGPHAPDDLKLVVGIGPVLERMLHKLGVTTYRQIARWSDRDIDDFDAKLPEFPGRIRRDAWVTQARELHLAKFGESLPVRERR
ncbi:MAG: hypothetical protein IT521_07325 [Burkholderiales bacterium]|nr:hypothetical protein [Burkholderiales bacterium]